MEELLHYVWKHKILPLRELKTEDGQRIEVISPGLLNRDAGPDFSGAKVKIDGVLWVGNVELHVHSTDWYRHGHDKDVHYDNIILHVVADADCEVEYSNGNKIPQLKIEVPDYVLNNYESLQKTDCSPRCAKVIGNMPQLMVHGWMTSLQVERFEMRMKQIMKRRDALDKNWEDTLFVTIARNFGFGKNGDAFEQWAHSIPMSAVGKHRDSLFQIEAIFFGQAGLLESPLQLPQGGVSHPDVVFNGCDAQSTPPSGAGGPYFHKLQKEYRYLRQKFSLTPVDPKIWKFLRLRPQNFPHIRIAQLAMLYYKQQLNMSRLINAESVEAILELFKTEVSEFWKTHYTFSSEESVAGDKALSKSSLDLIIINSVAPFLFAYGNYKGDDTLRERAFDLWENTKPENNRIIRDWVAAGISPEHAGDTQALIQLNNNYCVPHDCLRCRFGYEFIRRTPEFLREEGDKNNDVVRLS